MKKKKPLFQVIASEIAKREKGKSQVKIGDIRELLSLMAEIIVEKEETLKEFLRLGIKKAVKKAKKKAKAKK